MMGGEEPEEVQALLGQPQNSNLSLSHKCDQIHLPPAFPAAGSGLS